MLKKILLFSNYPKQVKYIFWNDIAERYSYYGMRSILATYMVTAFAMEEAKARETYHLFASGLYLATLLGAFVADKYFGKVKAIMIFSILYCVGHVFLSFFGAELNFFYVGLFLIALGAGGIKPCVPSLLGQQFTTEQTQLRTKAFNLFYLLINIGSFVAIIVTPLTKSIYGPQVAFMIPALLMFFATFMLFLGRKQYVEYPPEKQASFVKVVFSGLFNIMHRKEGKGLLSGALKNYSEEELSNVYDVINVLKIFSVTIFFWALFEQTGSSWVLQAAKMDLNFLGVTLQPEMLNSLNPLLIMVLLPIFNGYIYPKIDKSSFQLTPLKKIGIGLFLVSCSFVCAGFIQYLIDTGHSVNAMWQFIGYLLITLSEILISITGLEFAYTQAPKNMKATITGFWYLTVFFGDLVAAIINHINIFSGDMYFYVFAIMSLASLIVYIPISKTYQNTKYLY